MEIKIDEINGTLTINGNTHEFLIGDDGDVVSEWVKSPNKNEENGNMLVAELLYIANVRQGNKQIERATNIRELAEFIKQNLNPKMMAGGKVSDYLLNLWLKYIDDCEKYIEKNGDDEGMSPKFDKSITITLKKLGLDEDSEKAEDISEMLGLICGGSDNSPYTRGDFNGAKKEITKYVNKITKKINPKMMAGGKVTSTMEKTEKELSELLYKLGRKADSYQEENDVDYDENPYYTKLGDIAEYDAKLSEDDMDFSGDSIAFSRHILDATKVDKKKLLALVKKRIKDKFEDGGNIDGFGFNYEIGGL